MHEFLIAGSIGFALIITCSFIIYELLRFIWRLLPRLQWMPHARVLLLVVAVFAGHIINIWLFGAVYYWLHVQNLGTLTGTAVENGLYLVDFFGCLYFSAVSYSTLGLGDITPEGALHMIAGVEALTGFIMIGWTVTFTYLAMERFWELPHRRHKRRP